MIFRMFQSENNYFLLYFFMKTPPQNQENPPQSEQNQQSALHQLIRCEISEGQLDSMLKTISKIKLIDKSKITKLKKNKPLLNHVFKEMSEFFIPHKLKFQQKIIASKEARVQLRRKAAIRKMKIEAEKNLKEQQASESSGKSSPEIIEEIYSPLLADPTSSRCYICNKKYTEIDEFYHCLCPQCAEFSKIKRNQTADLIGLNALVTGARIKIGYEIAVKLLRDGATVYATTRFSRDALLRYQKQKDYENWKDRLFLIQCDFLSASQVQQLLSYLKSNLKKLDILINNAAQTITRPKQFFTFELQNQNKPMVFPPEHVIEFPNCSFPSIEGQKQLSIKNEEEESVEICLEKIDEFGQPLDLRDKNTWKEKIEDVSLFDCLSTQVINATVPFHLISQLKSLMNAGDNPKWIINVSSMEGVFDRRWKSPHHPHTNMAKAALNMITRTCAKDFSKQNIFMNSVDTGWVTNQNPYNQIVREANRADFFPPLDCVEGAMRVLDPIYQGVKHKIFPFGQFIKDYRMSKY